MSEENLLIETEEAIKNSGHKPDDIVFIGSIESGHSCTWDEFEVMANKSYDSGFGAQKVASDLLIVFKDGIMMKRCEYDGSEWWNYHEPFKEPEEKKEIKNLFVRRSCGRETLETINNEEEINE